MRNISTVSTLALGLSACIIPGGGVIDTYISDPLESSFPMTDISDAETGADPYTTDPTSGSLSTTNPQSTEHGETTCTAPCEPGTETTESVEDTSETLGNETSGTTECETCPVCGDGVVEQPEDCDDANQSDDDACANDCRLPRVVFVTAALHPGNFSSSSDGETALAEAYSICQTAAEELLVPGTFKAWLSTDKGSPSTQFDTTFTGWYIRRDDVRVAHGWTGLISDPLENPINVDVNGAVVLQTAPFAWTSTTGNGNLVLGGDCENWTADSSIQGLVGDIHATDVRWTSAEQKNCASEFRLYCFQDD